MRILFFCFLVIVTRTNAASAQRVGDTVVVVRDCEIKSENVVVDKAYPGLALKVHAIKGEALSVSNGIPGWIESDDTIPVEEAISHFTDQIRHNPIASHYGARGMVWYYKNEFKKALADCSEAIRLEPRGAAYFGMRGMCLLAKEKWDGAIADFDEAIRLEPTFRMYRLRGSAWEGKKDYDQAIADFDAAMRMEPKYVFAYSSAAWLRATCPQAKYRDGEKAVKDATIACKLEYWKRPESLDTLAAAYAEAGKFHEAVKYEELALGMVSEADNVEMRSRLALYKSGKPCRVDLPQ